MVRVRVRVRGVQNRAPNACLLQCKVEQQCVVTMVRVRVRVRVRGSSKPSTKRLPASVQGKAAVHCHNVLDHLQLAR
jgi:hypothetical protein